MPQLIPIKADPTHASPLVGHSTSFAAADEGPARTAETLSDNTKQDIIALANMNNT